MNAKWDIRMLELAQHISSWSLDPSTQVGAVVMRPDKTVASLGYNGFPRLVRDDSERLADRVVKYPMVVHAEANAIVCAREPLHGMSIYTYPLPPCASCTGLIIQAGIKRVVAPRPTDDQMIRWGDSFTISEEMFGEAEVERVLVR